MNEVESIRLEQFRQLKKDILSFANNKFFRFQFFKHNSRNIESEDFSDFIRYCAFLIRVGTKE